MKKKIGNILPPPPADKCNLGFKNFAAFTLAEILLSLTVIGIVAAIALPSLLGNANERAWETQKKALYTRFSQAIPLLPSLNGYGELEGTLSGNSDDGKQHVDTDTAAESFVRDGLSKVMKITNICDNDHLTDCGLPDKIIPLEGNAIELSSIKTLGDFNPIITNLSFTHGISGIHYNYEQLDTKAASFETVNGESILVYYNPNCEPDLKEKEEYYAQTKMCANFVYDLNGKKGPNTVGKDIGFITALYSTDSVVVSLNPYRKDVSDNLTYEDAATKCKEMGENIKVPSLYEMMSIAYNRQLVVSNKTYFWTSTAYSSTQNWRVSTTTGRAVLYNKIESSIGNVYCIKR